MGFINDLADALEDMNNKYDKKKQDELEKEMDAYELEEWQKELVRQGKYNPNNFEDSDDLEDEDYYYEDDN